MARPIASGARPPRMQRHPLSASGAPSGPAGSGPLGPARRRPRNGPRASGLGVTTGDEDGFTLVELLVVVLMLVTLVGIAVPTFVSQREGAFDAAVQSDVRSAAIALESFRAQNGDYSLLAVQDSSWGYVPSPDVNTVIEAEGDSYCIRGWYEPEQRAADGSVIARSSEPTDADAKAEWAMSPTGMSYVGRDVAPRDCEVTP